MMGGLIRRPIAALAEEHPEASRFVEWYDVIGIDSEHDYDPVWAEVPRAAHRAELPQRRPLDPAPQLTVELLLQPHRPLRLGR